MPISTIEMHAGKNLVNGIMIFADGLLSKIRRNNLQIPDKYLANGYFRGKKNGRLEVVFSWGAQRIAATAVSMAVKSMLYAIHSVAHDNEDGCYGDEDGCHGNKVPNVLKISLGCFAYYTFRLLSEFSIFQELRFSGMPEIPRNRLTYAIYFGRNGWVIVICVRKIDLTMWKSRSKWIVFFLKWENSEVIVKKGACFR